MGRDRSTPPNTRSGRLYPRRTLSSSGPLGCTWPAVPVHRNRLPIPAGPGCVWRRRHRRSEAAPTHRANGEDHNALSLRGAMRGPTVRAHRGHRVPVPVLPTAAGGLRQGGAWTRDDSRRALPPADTAAQSARYDACPCRPNDRRSVAAPVGGNHSLIKSDRGARVPAVGRWPSVVHDIHGGVRLVVDGRSRVFSVRCRCGWDSESCSSRAHAEAAGEQHLQLGAHLSRRAGL